MHAVSAATHMPQMLSCCSSVNPESLDLCAVGFGDMVPMTFVGRFAVLVMICIGVVLIPVQASQVYSQLQARRVTLGEPMSKSPKCGYQLHCPFAVNIAANSWGLITTEEACPNTCIVSAQ